MPPTDEDLKKHFTDILNHKSIIPDGHNGAFLVYADRANGNTGVQTGIAHRTAKGWQIEGDIGFHPHGEGLKAGVNVMKTW